jgi:hypothetical protein
MNGSLSFYLNKEKLGICFICKDLLDEEFLPAVSLINQGEMLQTESVN